MDEAINYKCPACGDNVAVEPRQLGETIACPHCEQKFVPDPPRVRPTQSDADGDDEPTGRTRHGSRSVDDEPVVRKVHPAMFRSHPFWFVGESIAVVGCLILAVMVWMWPDNYGLGSLTPLLTIALLAAAAFLGAMMLAWWVHSKMVTLTVTSKRTSLRRGIFSKQTSEVQHDDVRNLQVDQNFFQRVLGVGDLAISSSGQDDLEIVVKGIPNPDSIAALIRKRQ